MGNGLEAKLEELIKALGRPDPIGFRRALVSPPSRVYIGRDDRLFIRSRNALAGVILGFSGRFQEPDGTIVPFLQSHTPNTDRSAAIDSWRLGEGFLQSLVAHVTAGTPRRGQTFVELGILRGLAAATSVVHLLATDYVTATRPVGFPGSPVLNSLEGQGMMRSVAGTDPGAGNEVQETVPANARWALHGLTVQLVTAAAAANRQVHFTFDDGTTVLFRSVSATVQTAGLTHNYNVGGHAISSAAVAGEHFVPIPPRFLLFQGWRINTATDNLQVGDDFGPPELDVEEWLEE